MLLPLTSPNLTSPEVEGKPSEESTKSSWLSSSLSNGDDCSNLSSSIAQQQQQQDQPQSSQSQPLRSSIARRGLGSGAWSQPTTAPASVQVHYHYLAGRYRDLSHERGLGLLQSGAEERGDGSSSGSSSGARGNRSTIPSSSSKASMSHHAHLEGIPESLRDGNDSASNSETAAASLTPNGKTTSASSSLRAIARKNCFKDDASQHYSPKRLEDLFLGSKRSARRAKGLLPAKVADSATSPAKSLSSGGYRKAAPHGAKHASLRTYAEERIKAHELLEARIQRATDIGRLKWEAKAAILNNSYPLGILLYTRAAQLGSASASISLARIYCTGVTRGSKPVVVLLHRDPLLSLSWVLEAARLLEQRAKSRETRRGGTAAGHTSTSKVDKEQAAEIIAMLCRLMRCKQFKLTESEDVTLPPLGKGKVKRSKEEAKTAWQTVCQSMAWLEQQVSDPTSVLREDGESIGPDDDEDDAEMLKALQSRTQVAFIEALVATRRWAVGKLDERSFETAQTCWSKFAERQEAAVVLAHTTGDGNLASLLHWNRRFQQQDNDEMAKTLPSLRNDLDASLVESAVPVAAATPYTSSEGKLTGLDSPRKRRAGQLLRRKISLEELQPVDAEAKRVLDVSARPRLLSRHSTAEGQPVTKINEVSALAKPAAKAQYRHRAASMHSSSAIVSLDLQVNQQLTKRSTMQRVRRPSSVMSDSPSLLFVDRKDGSDDAYDAPVLDDVSPQGGLPTASSVASSLWELAPLQSRGPTSAVMPRKRVSSLYSVASVAPSEKVYTEGSTTFDYDIDASLRRQQARRKRGDSNASISTVASMLSTTCSISESMAESEYAKGHFMSPSTSSNINGFELRLNGAADSLRRIRKTSGLNTVSSREGPAAPQLTDTLEQLIANSASYRAVQARNPSTMGQQANGRARKNSTASMRSLTAFTANNQRQGAGGGLRSPSLYQTMTGRAFSVMGMSTTASPALSATTALFHSSPLNPGLAPQVARATPSGISSNNVTSNGSDAGRTSTALGSLRLLGKQSSSQTSRKAIPSAMKSTQQTTTSANAKRLGLPRQSPSPTKAAHKEKAGAAEKGSTVMPPPPPPPPIVTTRRAFESFDPTHTPTSSTAAPVMLSASSSRTNSSHNVHRHGVPEPTAGNTNSLDPALAQVEDRSGLKTTSTCLVCGQKVVNAPVSKSGDVFCGRDCRIAMKKRRETARKEAVNPQPSSDKDKGKERDEIMDNGHAETKIATQQ